MPAGRGSAIPKVPRTFLSVPQQPENRNGADPCTNVSSDWMCIKPRSPPCHRSNGEIEIAEFGAFKRDRRALAEWARELAPERVVMESTGTYWKSPYAALEKVGIHAMVVNARHAKGVPGRKTDIADARWLATLARAGLLRGSFVPPAQMRQLRLVSRQRQKLVGQCSAETDCTKFSPTPAFGSMSWSPISTGRRHAP